MSGMFVNVYILGCFVFWGKKRKDLFYLYTAIFVSEFIMRDFNLSCVNEPVLLLFTLIPWI